MVTWHSHAVVAVEELPGELIDESSLQTDGQTVLKDYQLSDYRQTWLLPLTLSPYLKMLIHFTQESQLSMELRLTR